MTYKTLEKHIKYNVLQSVPSKLNPEVTNTHLMRKFVLPGFSLFLCILLCSCGTEITKSYNTFKDLCEDSGGIYHDADRCKCSKETTPCDKGVICVDGECGSECSQSDPTKCDDSDGKAIQTRCDKGKWTTIECMEVSCNPDRTDCGECKTGELRCTDEGIIQKCETGEWIQKVKCPFSECKHNYEFECDNKTCECEDEQCSNLEAMVCSECKSGTLKCEPGDPQARYDKCIRGQWTGLELKCDTNECNEDKSGCKQLTCTENYTECKNGNRETCEKGKEMEYSACAPAADCKNETECGECINGKTKCENYKLSRCENGLWQTPPTAECHCANDEKCESCSVEGDSRCMGTKLEKCELIENVPSWSAPRDCTEGPLCRQNKCVDSVTCPNGHKQCAGDKIQTCIDGGWGRSRTMRR